MAMLNLDAFPGRDLQHLLALLSLAEGAGIDALRVLREQIEQHIRDERWIARKGRTPEQKQARRSPMRHLQPCPTPGCGGVLMPAANDEGLLILGCRACRYSQVEGR